MERNIPHTLFDNYPSLLKRFQSNFIDRVVTYSLIGAFFYCSMQIDADSWTLKILAIAAALSYEPVTVSIFRRTIGQRMTGIRVLSLTVDQKISLLNAYIRFFLRLILGWISFLAIHFNKERRALHDLATDTVLVM